MSNTRSKVKSYIRKGKLVKEHRRKKNTALKVAIGAASILGVSATSYLVLRKRYIGNLNKAAKSLIANPNVGKVLSDDKGNMLFTLGGFAAKGEKNKGEAIIMNKVIRQSLSKEGVRKTEFIALNHNWSTGKTQQYYEEGNKVFRYLTSVPQPTLKSIAKGRNDEAIKQANDIWSWVNKNPGKKVKLVGISAGGQMVKDVEYILRKRGVDVQAVTIGNFDNKMHNAATSLNIVNKHDTLVKATAPRNVTYIDVKKQKDFGGNHFLGNLLYNDKKEVNKPLLEKIGSYLKLN